MHDFSRATNCSGSCRSMFCYRLLRRDRGQPASTLENNLAAVHHARVPAVVKQLSFDMTVSGRRQ